MRGMASFIAGFGNGYFKAQDKKYERERQQKLDAQANELHTAKMSEIVAAQDERQRERDFREANVAALSAGKTDTGQVVTDAAGSNAYTKDADAAAVLQDMAQTANGGAQVAPATRVLTGMQGATQRGTIPGQQVFTDPAKAQEFAQSMPMSEYAKMQARKTIAEQYGKLEIADDMRGKLENLASKGVFKAGSLLDAGNADGALKVLQDMNPDLVPKGAQFKQVDVPDMFDRTKTAKGWALVAPGAEGQPERVLVGDFRDAVFGYLTPQEQFATKHTLNKSALDARKTEVAERQAATAERKIDLLLMGAGRSGGGGGGRGGAKDGGGPAVWDDKADAYLRERYTTKDPSTGEVRVDGSGLQFGKTLALAVSQNNGGDHTKGLGYAFQKDNELRAAATDKTGKYDAAKHEQLRQQYLMAISGQQATSPAPAATTGTQPNSGQRPARTSEGRGAIGNPMPSQILTTMGGILPKAGTYTPPPDSPAGKVQASREAARTATMKQEAERAKAVADAAAAAISSKDPSAAQAVQSMHGFGALPLEQKAEIRRIVFGR